MILSFDLLPYGTLAVSPKYTIFSFGSCRMISLVTVSPPTPESNTPTGAAFLLLLTVHISFLPSVLSLYNFCFCFSSIKKQGVRNAPCFLALQGKLKREFFCNIVLILRNSLFHFQCFVDIKVYIFAVLVAYDTVCLSFQKKLHCLCSHDGRVDTVFCCRASTTLHVSKNRRSCLHACLLFNLFCKADGVTDTFCIDDDVMLLSAFSVQLDIFDDLLCIIIMLFRKQNSLCSVGNTAPQRKVSRITSHNLNDT